LGGSLNLLAVPAFWATGAMGDWKEDLIKYL
jgi:hypothetical protein